jgi:hypothetical protein
MSISTKELDSNLLEAEFYEKPFYFSYSSLNKLLVAPNVFYREYVLKQREDEFKKYLLEGILIHYLVLEHQGFDDKFLVTPDSLPSANSIAVAEKIYEIYKEKDDDTLELADFVQEIDDVLLEMNLHQNVKDQDKRIAKIVEPKTESYFDFLKKQKGRTIIDSGLLDTCTRRADVVKANPQMRELLGLDIISDGKTYGVYNELELKVEAEKGKPFGYKGILDNLVVDVKNKTVRVNDFKTTNKTIADFSETVEYWNYWLQATMYMKLVRNFLKAVIKDDWRIEFRFITFDKYDQLYAFPVSETTMTEWTNRLAQVEKQAEYHYTSKDFTLPYDYALSNVEL